MYSQGLVVDGEITADGESVYWSRSVVSYDELDSLVDLPLATRAASGIAGLYPISDGCGC